MSCDSTSGGTDGGLEFSTPMYDNLETNLPHFLMEYSDDQSLRNNQLFPDRESTLQYLKSYANEIRHLVRFQTQVVEVLRETRNGKDSWQLRYRYLKSGKVEMGTYDAVVVASGHYSTPYVPEIRGISQWNSNYPGTISHSKFFQRPQGFRDRKVLIIGCSASGYDISAQIAPYCKSPVLISVRSDPPFSSNPTTTICMPEIVEFLPPTQHNRAVRFLNGQIETEIDAIVFCTGYFYSFPFLSSFLPELIDTGNSVRHLYQHIFSIDHPSLVFASLLTKVIPFRNVEGQAAAIARVWSGRIHLPPKFEMLEWEMSTSEGGRKELVHRLSFSEGMDYYDSLIEWAMQAKGLEQGKLPPKWSKKERWVRGEGADLLKAFKVLGEARHNIRTMEELNFIFDENHPPKAGRWPENR
ncbi:hypothetical protein MMC07_009369 [Pseudocyphellaria aurata]|nr:hypothetical protein [Pseudocyphellaria aurata]